MGFSIDDFVAKTRAKASEINDAFDKIAAVLNTQDPGDIIVADASSEPRPVSMSGHGTLDGDGELTLDGVPPDVLTSGAPGGLIICNAAGVPQHQALSGDATVDDDGVLTVEDDAVTGAKLGINQGTDTLPGSTVLVPNAAYATITGSELTFDQNATFLVLATFDVVFSGNDSMAGVEFNGTIRTGGSDQAVPATASLDVGGVASADGWRMTVSQHWIVGGVAGGPCVLRAKVGTLLSGTCTVSGGGTKLSAVAIG